MKKIFSLFIALISLLTCLSFAACTTPQTDNGGASFSSQENSSDTDNASGTDEEDDSTVNKNQSAELQADYEYIYTGISFKKSEDLTMNDLLAFLPTNPMGTAPMPPKTVEEFEQYLLDNLNTYTLTNTSVDGEKSIPLKTPYAYILVANSQKEEDGEYILYPYQGWIGNAFTANENGFFVSSNATQEFYVENGELRYDLPFNEKFSAVYHFEITQESEDRATLIRAYEEKLLSQGLDTQAFIDRYCGKYASGATVALMEAFGLAYPCVVGEESVANYDFSYAYASNPLRVLYDGKLYSLGGAHANGYLTEEDVFEIFKLYYQDASEDALQYGLKRRIILAAHEEKYPELGKAKIEVFYDQYNSGAIAAMLSAENVDFPDVIWTETVDIYEFYYSNGNRIIVLYENEFYTLTEAYAQEYISDFELHMLYTRHRNSHYALYISTELEDFSFALTWNTYGISSYDSQTGVLVKTKDAPNPEDFSTTCRLSDKTMQEIYEYFRTINFDAFPDVYDPSENMSIPYVTLILTVRYGEKVKTITANEVAYDYIGKDGSATTFLDVCKFLQNILENTEEWKSLPDYPYLYD